MLVYGGGPGTVGASTSSGTAQNTGDFSHLLERFTGKSALVNA